MTNTFYYHSIEKDLNENCSCDESWLFTCIIDLAKGMRCLTESDRLTTLRAALLVLASPKEPSNEAHSSHSSSEKIQQSDAFNEQKNSITYLLRSQSVSRGVFITVFNISRSTLNRHCTEICSTTQFKP